MKNTPPPEEESGQVRILHKKSLLNLSGSKGFVVPIQPKPKKVLSHCKTFHVCTSESPLKTNHHIVPQDTAF